MAALPDPSLDSLRRQLEGRWEHLERARTRYTGLARRLDSFQWRQELRKSPGLVRETREREAELGEVLTYVEQRAQREQWPAQHPGLKVVRELHAQRRELEGALNRCLARPRRRGTLPFLQLLEQVEALALEPEPEPPTPDEFVLVQGGEWAQGARSRYWLTARRLLWRTWDGTLLQVKLDTLAPGDVQREAAGWGVRVEGPRSTFLRYGWGVGPMANLIGFCRALSAAPAEAPQVQDLFVCRAYSHGEHFPSEARRGVAIFRPGSVVFLPTRRLTAVDHLSRLFGREVRRAEDAELLWQEALVEHLRQLSPHEFDGMLRDLVQARDGLYWPSAEVRSAPDAETQFRFARGGRILGVDRSARLDVLKSFIAEHMPNILGMRRQSWMRSHWSLFKIQGVIGLGMLLFLQPFVGLWLPKLMGGWVWGSAILTRVAFSWACMRYAKAKNRPPLMGLGLSVLGMMGGLFLFFSTQKKKPSKHSLGFK